VKSAKKDDSIIARTQAVLESGTVTSEDLAALLDKYRKLALRMDRLTRIGDRQQLQLKELNELKTQFVEILEQRVAERTAELRRSERHLQSVMDTAADAIVTVDVASGSVVGLNQSACGQFARSVEETVGQPARILLKGQAEVPRSGDHVLEACRPDGGTFPWEISAAVTSDGATLVITGRDITQRLAAEREIHFLAHHDPITELPNRRAARIALTLAITEAAGDITVAYVEVKNLGEIGRALGLEVLEAAQRRLGERLRAAVPEPWTVASWGQDFLILAEGDQSAAEASLTASVQSVAAEPMMVDGAEVSVALTVGAALAPRDGDQPLQLIRRASMAAFSAVRRGLPHAVFDVALSEAMARRAQLIGALRHARERDELRLFFQPKVCFATKKVVGAEALARWFNAEMGFVSPGEFIPLAEESGLVEGIGQWALETACQQAAEWCRADPSFIMAVNLSSHDLDRPGFVDEVAACLDRHGLPPANLELEVTETAVMGDRAAASAVLRSLGDLGISVAIDDFGTGYSSLSYLSTLPAHVLKVDQGFVRRMTASENDRSIVRVIVGLAQTLSMKTVAEGVETPDDAAFLLGLGCTLAQGYLYGKPCPPDEFQREFLGRSLQEA
jgi:predicted signal transduction protein with EAL and GGDEF domain